MSLASSLQVIKGLMPIVQAAAQTIAAFTGKDDTAARADDAFQKAAEIIGAVSPLVDSFSRGGEVTIEDARAALADADDALAVLDAEIARQKQGG
jgi:hypothetical protein